MTAATTSTTKSAKTRGSNQQATRQAVDANTSHLRFHLGDTEVDVSLPPLNKLAFYAGLSAGAVFGLIEWPIASSPASGTCSPMTATTAPCKPSAKLSTPPDPGQKRRPNNHHPASAGNADDPLHVTMRTGSGRPRQGGMVRLRPPPQRRSQSHRSVKNSKIFFSIVPTSVPPEKPTLPAWARDREGAAVPLRGQR